MRKIITLEELVKEEKKGIIFCKIGKSSSNIQGKGGYLPYRDYIGKVLNLNEGSITFERLDDVVQYLHYGDELVLFSFTSGIDLIEQRGFSENEMNKGCYNATSVYVDKVLSFKHASTVDFIYSNSCSLDNFKGMCNLATSHLKDRGLFDAANRWKELI